MRITNPMTIRNYTKGLNKNNELLNKYSAQIYTGRRLYKMSEDTAAGVRVMQVRRSLSALESQIDNVNAAKSQLDAAESTLNQISELSHTVSEKLIQGMSDGAETQDREIIATELERLREHLLSLANGQFSGRFMFGGTNTITAPFVTDSAGNLYYNGVNVRDLDKKDSLINDSAHLDIGLGVSFNNTSDPQAVDSGTAFKNTLIGAEILGLGDDNIFLLVTDMINVLRTEPFEFDKADNILGRFRESAANVNTNVTRLGADSQYLDYTLERLETDKVNLQARQDDLEAANPEEAIMNFKVQEYIYNAALQMGQRLLQPTLFSFIS